MTVVVDASIAIKWFVPENLREPALNLLQTEEHVAAPDLLIPDLTGLVLKKIQRNEITGRQAGAILSGIENSGLEIGPASDMCEQAMETALTLDLSVYNCFYIATATRLDATYVTADNRLHATTCDSSLDGAVRVLSA